MSIYRSITVDELIKACPYSDFYYTVDSQVDSRLRALGIGHEMSPFIFLGELKVYGFIGLDGRFDTFDKYLLDGVWPGYTHKHGYAPQPL